MIARVSATNGMTTPMAILAPVERPELPELTAVGAVVGVDCRLPDESAAIDAEAAGFVVMTRFAIVGIVAVGATAQPEGAD